MDLNSITEFLGSKTILLTGATGFIAKLLLEKILRIQPNVNKVYLLIRARDAESAHARLQDEVLRKELFCVLREKLGADFESFASKKITPIAGDTSYENMGVSENQLQEMYENADIIINVAATTNFEERYEVALGVNTFGAKNVVNFAKKCAKVQLLIHVSTAYVCGDKEGLIYERPYNMGETLNGVSGLDIDSEKKLAQQTLSSLNAKDLPEREIRQRMKTLGSQRAKLYGWPNAYVFTKAMGEMVVGQLRGNLPVVIMRPTIVSSTLKEPIPGWIEGCKGFESFAVAYGKGRIRFALAAKSSTLDLIPADMLVNSIIVAMKTHVNQPNLTIYQVGTSFRNPITIEEVNGYLSNCFIKHPWSNREGNHVKVRKGVLLYNRRIFDITLYLLQFVLQMILILASRMGFSSFQHILINFDKKLKLTKKLVEACKPYLFFKGIFVDTNIEKLLVIARENDLDADIFNFDPQCINWKDYFFNAHFPSMVKFLL